MKRIDLGELPGVAAAYFIAALILFGFAASAAPPMAASGNATNLNGATMAAPGAIGGTTPAAGSFTTLGATTSVTAPTVTTSTGELNLTSATGGVRVGGTSLPTIASGACGATTNGTVTAGSRSNAGQIVIGAAATTVCTVVFSTAMTTAPVCILYPANSTAIGALILAYVSANTTAGFVITGSVLANTTWNYHCL